MKKFFISLIVLTLSPLALMAQKVGVDKTYRVGRLKNGLTYYIRHNAKEAGLADFYIVQRVGSILEEPRQRGLAHFLEHMAFNGSQNFQGTPQSPGIVHWCEAHGIKFGANLNAYTSVDETVYHVSSVPVKGGVNVDSTLLILHDWSHYLNLSDVEIDKERGVIHEEWRNRRSGKATQRMMEEALPIIYRGSKYEDCMPIGSMDIVDHFPYRDLRDYYHKWYRPDLQAIIVVGDIDVDAVEAKVKSTFGNIPMPADAAKRIYYPVGDNEDIIVASLKNKEQPIMLVNLYMKRDATPDAEKDGVDYQRDGYIEALIDYMTGERLNEMQNAEIKPCLSASARNGQFFISRTKDAFTLSFGARQENVKGSFDAAIGTIERIRQHGFTQAELDRAKAFRKKVADRTYRERNDRRNSYFVRKAQANFLENEPLLSEDEDKDLQERFAREVSLKEVNAVTRKLISDRNQVLVVYAPDKPDFQIPTDAELKKYVKDAQSRKYPVYKDVKLTQNLLAHEPKAGRIVSEKPSIHGTTEFTLSNGLKVYFKHTDYNKDQVVMHLFGEGGTSVYPDKDAVNFEMIPTAINKSGVGNFDELTLDKILAGKSVKVRPFIGVETQGISGSSSVADAKTMFQLAYLYFTQPRRDDRAFQSEVGRMHSFLTNREASPNVSYNDSLSVISYGDNPRTRPFKAAMLKDVDYGRILQIYRDRFSNAGNFRLIVLGNIEEPALRPLLEKYMASLPSTGKEETFAHTYPNVRDVNEVHQWNKKMETPQSKVSIIYTWPEKYSAQNDLKLDILKRLLSIAYTDSVREEKGGVYGVSLSASLDKNSTPEALLKISFTTDPAKYSVVMPIVYRQIANIAQYGPEASSMNKVKEYLVKQYHQAAITNDYWDYVLYNEIRNGVDFDSNYPEMVEAVSDADIRQMAADILKSNRRIEITMHSAQ